jgi:hypothetical protein
MVASPKPVTFWRKTVRQKGNSGGARPIQQVTLGSDLPPRLPDPAFVGAPRTSCPTAADLDCDVHSAVPRPGRSLLRTTVFFGAQLGRCEVPQDL